MRGDWRVGRLGVEGKLTEAAEKQFVPGMKEADDRPFRASGMQWGFYPGVPFGTRVVQGFPLVTPGN